MDTTRATTPRVPPTLHISGVSAESRGRMFAGLADNSVRATFHADSHVHHYSSKFLGRIKVSTLITESLGQPETTPGPLSTVPFVRDDDFVSRDTLLEQIREKCSVEGSRIALVGLGGVGKSQLAIEYSYRVRSQSQAIWVFWVHASNAARFEQSFRGIADQVKITGRDNPNANIFQLVENWLRDERQGKWLVIVDNFDDDGLLCQLPARGLEGQRDGHDHVHAPTKPLFEYLPRALHGSVIVTSRTKEVALKIVDHKDLIEIEPMKGSEALELLQKKLKSPGDRRESLELVEELEFMPLAIVQAAGYINHRAPRCSVSQYLDTLRKSHDDATRLLKYEPGHLHRDWQAKNSILFTWQISFNHIRENKPSAADLLSLMSFFDRQRISEDLLRVQHRRNHWSSEETNHPSISDTDHDFEDDIATLRDYSFISVGEDRTVFTMHRLVQLSARVWLQGQRQIEKWKEQFISILCHHFPTDPYYEEWESWERCRWLFPHVKSAMSEPPESPGIQQQWASLLYNGAGYAWRSGNLADAREMASKSLEQNRDLLGEEDPATLASTAMLARVYHLQGQLEEAEKLQVRVVEARKRYFSEDHPDTLMAMGYLATTYMEQGRLADAEKLRVHVVDKSRTALGEDHPDTLRRMENLATTYMEQGRLAEAEKLRVYVMDKSKTALGEDHPDTLRRMENLAATYRSQGQEEEAEMLEVQVMISLAFTCKYSGRDVEALNLLRDCRARMEAVLEPSHPSAVSVSETLLQWEMDGLYTDA
ncbi:hypothetical protein N7474_002899 [Penicillium riverlandense]|uniref:uncharacterized protein n=1 Tax=Penicillium riverlandense TaxID=1903569 RepID=UPI0025473FEA|nr:uncharacterized protein N7474_002899 [Penicillium riverlandense]KAJ5825761.1 hypothetical protein N7474_002899 [Penicillium riverlandense]